MTDQSGSATSQRRRSGFRSLVGYTTKVWAERYGEVELVLGPQHLNSLGVVHGGIYAAMLDVALGHAVSFCATPGNGRYSTTVSLNTTFLKGIGGGVITACGRVEGVEGRMATCTGVRCATRRARCSPRGRAASLYFPGSERPDGVPKHRCAD